MAPVPIKPESENQNWKIQSGSIKKQKGGVSESFYMMDRALKRLFLIFFPLSLLLVSLFLTNKHQPRDKMHPHFFKKAGQGSAFLESKCFFYLGLSFFPIEEKKQNFFKGKQDFQAPLWASYLLSDQDFVQTLQTLKEDFKKEKWTLKKILFVFPLALTKDDVWIISKKTFFILPTGERKELSHLTYLEIKTLHESLSGNKAYVPLKLEKVFSYLPNEAHFLFYLEGSHREKIIRNLDKNLKEKTKGEIYLSSSNEKLLKEIISLGGDWSILHSFKTLVRFQIMSLFTFNSFKNMPGRGLIVPSIFPLSFQIISFLQDQKKLLFFEKDPPYNSDSQVLIQKAQALISSQPKSALSIIKSKKPCFIKN